MKHVVGLTLILALASCGSKKETNNLMLKAKEAEKYKEKLDLYFEALTKATDDQTKGEIHFKMGKLYEDCHVPISALDHYENAFELVDKHDRRNILFNMGNCYSSGLFYKEARDIYNQALDYYKKPSGVQKTINAIGLTYLSEGDTSKALGRFKTALPLDKKYKGWVLSNMGLCYVNSQPDSAQLFFEQAVADTLNRIKYHAYYNLSQLHKNKGNDSLMMAYAFQSIHDSNDNLNHSYKIISDYYKKIGDQEKTIKFTALNEKWLFEYKEQADQFRHHSAYYQLQLSKYQNEQKAKTREMWWLIISLASIALLIFFLFGRNHSKMFKAVKGGIPRKGEI